MNLKDLVILLMVIVLALLFLLVQKQHSINDLQARSDQLAKDLSREEQFSDLLLKDNERLRGITEGLKQRVIEEEANLSRYEHLLGVCTERSSYDIPTSPVRRVDISDVFISDEAVLLDIGKVVPGIISDSDSMLPILSEGQVVLEREPAGPDELYPGDVIIFEADGTRIIHRIVAVGVDDFGWYAVTRGDHNRADDPWRVRFNQVRGVVVGIIY